MLRIAPYTYRDILGFAIDRKIDGIPTAVEVEAVSPSCHIVINKVLRGRLNSKYFCLPLASHATEKEGKYLVAGVCPKVVRTTNGDVLGCIEQLELCLNWGTAIIEQQLDDMSRYRIVICDKTLWGHGVWNPLRLSRISQLN